MVHPEGSPSVVVDEQGGSPTQWQPISTAPRDNRPIYVLSRAWGNRDGRWVLGRGLWIEDGWRGPGFYDLDDEGNHLSYAELWAPDTLPPVPPHIGGGASSPSTS